MNLATGDTLRGYRFFDDESVLSRLESMYREEQFILDLVGTTDAALLDAARADYWYTHEKDWGDNKYDGEVEDCEVVDND